MAQTSLSPSPKQYFWYVNTNEPLSGGLVYTVSAGGSFPGNAVTTYTDVNGAVPNANPIVLNGSGYCVIYLVPGQSYKYIVYSSVGGLGVTNSVLQWTQDNIVGPPLSSGAEDITGTAGENIAAEDAVYLSDGSGGKNAGQWYKASATNAYSSSEAGSVGLAVAAVLAAATGTFRTSGHMAIVAQSLNPGSKYYVGATAGTITTSVLPNSRFVGEADGVNSIILAPNPFQGQSLDFVQIWAFS